MQLNRPAVAGAGVAGPGRGVASWQCRGRRIRPVTCCPGWWHIYELARGDVRNQQIDTRSLLSDAGQPSRHTGTQPGLVRAAPDIVATGSIRRKPCVSTAIKTGIRAGILPENKNRRARRWVRDLLTWPTCSGRSAIRR
ncbi:hypothetical protein Asi03nite_60100 [Actinoplanes siamensis]|uniref:Uncharacterized protein n=1 Tax=Actinoplanes siamensis TaxID=1223317 RepID=A0A919NC45_9ACTN|nr:hypothetical protein Asi03nite_60100 [Actinoplanes siamensis]